MQKLNLSRVPNHILVHLSAVHLLWGALNLDMGSVKNGSVTHCCFALTGNDDFFYYVTNPAFVQVWLINFRTVLSRAAWHREKHAIHVMTVATAIWLVISTKILNNTVPVPFQFWFPANAREWVDSEKLRLKRKESFSFQQQVSFSRNPPPYIWYADNEPIKQQVSWELFNAP